MKMRARILGGLKFGAELSLGHRFLVQKRNSGVEKYNGYFSNERVKFLAHCFSSDCLTQIKMINYINSTLL